MVAIKIEKELTEAILSSIEYVKNEKAPDGVYFYIYSMQPQNFHSIIRFAKHCEDLIKKEGLYRKIDAIYRIPVYFNHSKFDYKFVGLNKVKDKLSELICFDDAKCTFYDFELQQFTTGVCYEWHKYLINDFLSEKFEEGINLYYVETKDSESTEYSRYIYIEISNA
ncbi:MAG: hypothetical protein ACXWEY_13655 [Bacteroidia bacterium]